MEWLSAPLNSPGKPTCTQSVVQAISKPDKRVRYASVQTLRSLLFLLLPKRGNEIGMVEGQWHSLDLPYQIPSAF